VVMVTIGLPGSWKSGTPQLVQVTRQPRVDRSPRRDPLFERCRANGAPHSLQTKPTHSSWLVSVSLSFAVRELLDLIIGFTLDRRDFPS